MCPFLCRAFLFPCCCPDRVQLWTTILLVRAPSPYPCGPVRDLYLDLFLGLDDLAPGLALCPGGRALCPSPSPCDLYLYLYLCVVLDRSCGCARFVCPPPCRAPLAPFVYSVVPWCSARLPTTQTVNWRKRRSLVSESLAANSEAGSSSKMLQASLRLT